MKLIPAAMIICLTGCMSMPYGYDPAVEANLASLSFNESEHAAYSQPGTGEIKGQGFLRQNGGGVVTCAGKQVVVMPDTAYFRTLASAARSRVAGYPSSPNAVAMTHSTQCDAQGNFVVSGLAAGNWLVATEVTWMVGYQPQGGGLLKSVTVTDGASTNALLTEADFYAR